jgi:transposase-like protein
MPMLQSTYSAVEYSQLRNLVKEFYLADSDEDEAMHRPMREMLRRYLENVLRLDLARQLQASRYQRSPQRTGYRNGSYTRGLVTSFGAIPMLTIPRLRKGRLTTKVFRRYQRRWKKVDAYIRKLFFTGVSTRETGLVLEDLLGARPSASTVSNINKTLTQEVRQFQRRPLTDDYRFLILDGIWVKVNGHKVVKKVILVAYGIRHNGIREIVGLRQARAESSRECELFLLDLRQRGLLGENLQLLTIDGSVGLKSGIEVVYPGVSIQRCWVHKLRNVSKYLKASQRDACLKAARSIYLATTYREAVARFKHWAKCWRTKAPKAVACLEADLEELLTFLKLLQDQRLRIKVRTTNAIERTFRELRKRIRPFCSFANSESCDRLITALFITYNRKWKEKPLWKLP